MREQNVDCRRESQNPHPENRRDAAPKVKTNCQGFATRRFFDFNVWSDAKRKEKLHYMHANPVRERLVKHPKEWPWSSFSFYAKDEQGLIRIDPVE